jgi:hypothetical protein
LDSVDIAKYDPVTKKWTVSYVGRLQSNRSETTAAAIGHKAIFVGGIEGRTGRAVGFPSSLIDIYDDRDGTWTHTRMNRGFTEIAIAMNLTMFFILGGKDQLGPVQSTAMFDPANDDPQTALTEVGSVIAQSGAAMGVASCKCLPLRKTECASFFSPPLPVFASHCCSPTPSSLIVPPSLPSVHSILSIQSTMPSS